jgi:hypothetical protein
MYREFAAFAAQSYDSCDLVLHIADLSRPSQDRSAAQRCLLPATVSPAGS